MTDEPKRGDVVIDDGVQWRITSVAHENGKTLVSRVRVGSLAEQTIFGREEEV